ncbi:MAG: DUF4340 domain-containing protein [Acetobacter sp.]|nr:DUF4340 domain-containing protein [Acetobacter sp.]
MRHHIKIALLLICIILPFFCIGFLKNSKNFLALSRGNYFFQHSRNNLQLENIVLDFGNNQKLTFNLQDGFWRLKEADDYFVAYAQANALMRFITDTVIYRADKLNDTDIAEQFTNSIKITNLDNQGNILDYAQISLKQSTNRYHYARINNTPYLYQINGNFSPSNILMDWIQMPLLQIDKNTIKRIDTHDFAIYRRFSDEQLKLTDTDKPAIHINQLINNLWFLNAEEVKHITHFNPKICQKNRHYDITLFSGLIYSLDIYTCGEEYWLNIKLGKETLSTSQAQNFLDEHQILYDGWFFKIDKNKGYLISNFMI